MDDRRVIKTREKKSERGNGELEMHHRRAAFFFCVCRKGEAMCMSVVGDISCMCNIML